MRFSMRGYEVFNTGLRFSMREYEVFNERV